MVTKPCLALYLECLLNRFILRTVGLGKDADVSVLLVTILSLVLGIEVH